jgi:hypothetical protein
VRLTCQPTTAREKTPSPVATACPIRVLRGLEVWANGRPKKRSAVNPYTHRVRGGSVGMTGRRSVPVKDYG